MAKKKGSVASVLAFEKKLVPSDGYMYGTNWDNLNNTTPLKLVEKSVRGTISNRLKDTIANDPMKLNAEVEKANLQRVDSCSLSENQDTLKLHFTLRVLGNIIEPSACNESEFLKLYQEAVKSYIDKFGFEELGKRYALNLANARFLWRNRVGAGKIKVIIKEVVEDRDSNGSSWEFDAKSYPLKEFNIDDEQVLDLGKKIANTLSGDSNYLLLDIKAYAKIGDAQEVYPSEELILDKGQGNKQGKKSKVLYEVDGIAAMHSQKLGNAIRTIDTWYRDFVQEERAIAIEPYGAVTNLGRAFRNPKNKEDFFTLFDKFVKGDEELEDEQLHYVMAVLVRGGVFGESDK